MTFKWILEITYIKATISAIEGPTVIIQATINIYMIVTARFFIFNLPNAIEKNRRKRIEIDKINWQLRECDLN